MVQVKIEKLYSDANIPTKGSEKAAGFDLYAYLPEGGVWVKAHETVKIGTGLSIQPPANYFGAIAARSGLATKKGLRPANCLGICDEDYTGEYIVAIHNDSEYDQYIYHGDRIAQLIFMPYLNAYFLEVDALDETERGSGGFGSTGDN
jgi:dUTP pyrophosphatase